MGYVNRLGHQPIIWHACGLVPHRSGDYTSGRPAPGNRNTMWPQISRWCCSLSISPCPDIDVLIVNTKSQRTVEKQLIANGQSHIVLGQNEKNIKRWTHTRKLELLLDGCQRSTKPYLCTMDAFDCVYSGDLSALISGLGDKQMLLSADVSHWPSNSPGKEKINSGCWLAKREYAIRWLTQAVAAAGNNPTIKNDQYWYNALYDPEHCLIDYDRMYIQTELRPKYVFNDFFSSVRCINLDKRPDRWERCVAQYEQWPFALPERFAAIDGTGHGRASGMLGCKLSHMQVIQEAQERGDASVFTLEDDFELCDSFTNHISLFLDHVPDDWDVLWVGGIHNRRPIQINNYVSRVRQAVNCHAYVVRDSMYQTMLDFWSGIGNHHIDNTFQHEQQKYHVYCPTDFLIGQRGGTKSNISGGFRHTTKFWSGFDRPAQPNNIMKLRRELLRERIAATPG